MKTLTGIIIVVLFIAGIWYIAKSSKQNKIPTPIETPDNRGANGQNTVVPYQSGLPTQVEDMRNKIAEAAALNDYDELARLAGSEFKYSFGIQEEGGLRKELDEIKESGKDPSKIILTLLSLPYGHSGNIYAWPSFFLKESKDWTNEDISLMKTYMTDAEIEGYREFGGYAYYRIGIRDDGKWIYFIAGD